MKFAASLIAIGASAVKLREEDQAHPVQRMIDWNGDGLIQREEAKDQAYIFYATGYIDEEDLHTDNKLEIFFNCMFLNN